MKNSNKLWMILALVLVIGVAAFMTYMLSKSDDTPTPPDLPSQSDEQTEKQTDTPTDTPTEKNDCNGNHTYGEWVQTKAPTCTQKGAQKRSCSVCNATENGEIDAKGHSYTSVNIAAGKNTFGYTKYTCGVCEHSYKADMVAPLGSDGLTYALNSDGETYKVKGIGSCTDTFVAVPATYNGKPVTVIGDEAFRMCQNMTGIYLPDSIKRLGDSAFAGCTGLTQITLPKGLSGVGTYTFYGCSNIKMVIMPIETRSAGNFAFYGCKKLDTILYFGTAEDWSKMSINANGNDALTGKDPERKAATVYFYSEERKAGTWCYVDGEPVITTETK